MARRSKRFYLKNLSYNVGSIHLKLDMSRFERQFQQAQYYLDGAVMNSMVPYMPMVTGSFINTTRAASAAVQEAALCMPDMAHKGVICTRARLWLMN